MKTDFLLVKVNIILCTYFKNDYSNSITWIQWSFEISNHCNQIKTYLPILNDRYKTFSICKSIINKNVRPLIKLNFAKVSLAHTIINRNLIPIKVRICQMNLTFVRSESLIES